MIVTKRNGETHYVKFSDFPMTIGRDGTNTIVIDDSVISQHHVTIGKRFRGGFFIKDKGSSSGTFLNSQRITKENISEGQEFFLGDIRGVFCKTEDVDKYRAEGKVYKKGDWYFADGENFKGPFSSREFKKLALKGVIRKDTKIMTEGNFSVANKIQGLIFSEQIDEVASKTPSAPQTSQVESFGDILCPHCWWKFNYEEILYIAEHPDLVGDPICGDVQKRFLPEKFTSTGKAIDMKGMPCADMACPKCHVFIPKIALKNNDPMIFSIVGAPNSGKSFLLTSMIYMLRQILPTKFNISMVDADPKANFLIHDYENTFFYSDPEKPVSLNKTEEQGDLYNKVIFDDIVINLPKPIFLQMSRMDQEDEGEDLTKTIVMYDNSGESFQPGKDTINNPATLHLGHSESIFYLFDPLQNPKFKSMISSSGNSQVEKTHIASRQEILLDEVVNRIEKNTNSTRPFNKSIYILVTKFDLWKNLLSQEITSNPWEMDDNGIFSLKIDTLYNTSLAVRSLIEKVCPQMVHSAEENFDKVVFIPVSAIGKDTSMIEMQNGMFGVKPKDIKPFGTSLPLISVLSDTGYVKTVSNRSANEEATAFPLKRKFKVFIDDECYILPNCYLHKNLTCPKTGKPFRPVLKSADSSSESSTMSENSLMENSNTK